MPKRTDIKTILVLGSGPIVIGQGCEFDYSGTQACKSLKDEGYRIVLVNSNPATIMTDPQFSDRTYIEPITPEAVRKIIENENKRGPRIDAILPTLGGQTALNCACKLFDNGTLREFGIEMIGANREVIHRAEDRQVFKDICEKIGLKLPKAKTVTTLDDAFAFLEEIGLPAIIRPAFTLGGSGGGIAYNREEFRDICTRGLMASMIGQIQIDQSVIGWKEYELEVVRDKKDNCIIVCGIENIDAMGVHTGDSITVAPILTLTDKEYQAMRDAAFAVMRAVGVETGGSNVQFAVNPNPTPRADGTKPFEMVVVEMNPRVSRSSALASKATGFPIAKIAAKLAIGYTLDELKNDITGTTSACFEPTIDYVVTKMPRWTFEKFPEADETLTTQMKSVGEAMAIGRTFKESLQKVIRSMDVKRFGLGLDRNDKWLTAMRAVEHGQLVLDVMGTGEVTKRRSDEETKSGSAHSVTSSLRHSATSSPTGLRTADGQLIEWPIAEDKLSRKLAVPSQGRMYYVRYAFKMGWSIEKVHALTKYDHFFLDQILQLVEFEDTLCDYKHLEDVPASVLFEAKQLGYSDAQLANLYLGTITIDTILQVREHRKQLGIEPVYKLVDTCAAEFEAKTPYYYSTYERMARFVTNGIDGRPASAQFSSAMVGKQEGSWTRRPCIWATDAEDEVRISSRPKVVILGGGPNRIGQGIEFDYCCCHAAFAAKELGFESVMINSNPETVSTDYDTSDLLFFEPLTLEDALNVIERLHARPLNPVSLLVDDAPPSVLAEIRRSIASTLGLLLVIACKPDPTSKNGVCVSILDQAGKSHHIRETQDGAFSCVEADDNYTSIIPDGPTEMQAHRWLHQVQNAPRGLVHGIIVQFGGQTPLNLAKGLVAAGAPIIGTSVDSIDRAEDRNRFDEVLEKLKLHRPPAGIARSVEEAVAEANRIGYPVLLRPSYVLGGRGMEICPDEKALRNFIDTALRSSALDEAPVLIDKFLDGATEVDVDVVADFDTTIASTASPSEPPAEAGGGSSATASTNATPAHSRGRLRQALIAGIMEQIEQAGIHSGDSACTLPPASLSADMQRRIADLARGIAAELRVCGLMNIQLAVKDDKIYVLEVNPRASRTVPFVSKATHVPWPALAAKAMMGKSLAELGAKEVPLSGRYAIKESVFPFSKFPGVDVVLGPEMRSTGEVMGLDRDLAIAFAKSQMAAGADLPTDPSKGGVFVSVRLQDRPIIVEPIRSLIALGFKVYATEGTAAFLAEQGVKPNVLQKIGTGARPNVLDLMNNREIALIINTPTRTGWKTDEGKIRSTAVRLNIPMITTSTAAVAAVKAIEALRARGWGVAALQDYL